MTKQAAPGLSQFIYYYLLLSWLRSVNPRMKLPFSLQKACWGHSMNKEANRRVCIYPGEVGHLCVLASCADLSLFYCPLKHDFNFEKPWELWGVGQEGSVGVTQAVVIPSHRVTSPNSPCFSPASDVGWTLCHILERRHSALGEAKEKLTIRRWQCHPLPPLSLKKEGRETGLG